VGAASFTGNLVFWARPNIIFANAKWFDSLSSDQQSLLRAAVAESSRLAVARLPDNAREARDKFCAASFAIKSASNQELDTFRQRLQPVIDGMAKDPTTKATIDAITALRGPTMYPMSWRRARWADPAPRRIPDRLPLMGPGTRAIRRTISSIRPSSTTRARSTTRTG